MRKELARLKRSIADTELKRDINNSLSVIGRFVLNSRDPETNAVDPELLDGYLSLVHCLQTLSEVKGAEEERRPKRRESASASRARNLPKGEVLLAEFYRLVESKGSEKKARSVLYAKYKGKASQRAIRDKINRARKRKAEDSER